MRNKFSFHVVEKMLPKRWWTRILFILAAVILVPYVFTRMMAPSRRIAVFPDSNGAMLSTSGKETVRVACYNIAHGRGTAESNWSGGSAKERMDRLNAIGQLLKEIDADVVVLNEVDFDSSWSHCVNQAEYLAKVAGYSFRAEERNIDFRVLWWKWRFGNAILSKTPISNAKVIDFPNYAGWETLLAGKKRGIKCDFAFNGDVHAIVGAHLSHRSENLRVKSAQMLVGYLHDGLSPLIVAGDMNSTPADFPNHHIDANGHNAIQVFDQPETLSRRPLDAPPAFESLTFPSMDPKMVIDWILVSSGGEYRFLEYRVVRSTLSDHLPVCADISLFPNHNESGSPPVVSQVD